MYGVMFALLCHDVYDYGKAHANSVTDSLTQAALTVTTPTDVDHVLTQ